jgi:hypothetical protein
MAGYIESLWQDFERDVMPKDAGETQRRESRRCFYAGAQSLLTFLMIGLDPGADPTDTDLAKMDDISAELHAFSRAVLEGRA